MCLDESSLSRSVLFTSDNMIGWHIFISLWNSMYLYDKMFYTLAFPFACLVALYVVLLFSDDHQFIDVSRCEEHLRSTGKGWFHCIVYLDWTSSFYLGFSLGLWPMYCFGFWCIINYCYVLVLIFVLVSWCA